MIPMLQTVQNYPPITKLLLAGLVIPLVLEYFSMANYVSYAYIPRLVAPPHYQWWRLVTSYLYMGPLSLNVVMHGAFLLSQSEFLELTTSVADVGGEGHDGDDGAAEDAEDDENRAAVVRRYQANTPSTIRRSLNYTYFLFITALLVFVTVNNLSVFCLPTPPRHFAKLFSDILLYIWCRRNTEMQVMVMGVIQISASYLPLLYLLFQLPEWMAVLMDPGTTWWNVWGKIMAVVKFDLLSIFLGHLLWWLDEVAVVLWGVRVLTPPWEWL